MGSVHMCDGDAPKIRTIFWALVVVFGTGFAIYQVVTQVMVYLTWPVTMYVNVSHVSELPFPRVIICNQNYLQMSTIPGGISEPVNLTAIQEAANDSALYNGTNYWENFYIQHAHKIEDMLLHVSTPFVEIPLQIALIVFIHI